MLSFDSFKIEGSAPIYIQIILHIKRGIVAGTVADGDELPSRRVLSALLGVNPNTVQKAYRMLEDEGLIVSRAGAGSSVALTDEKCQLIRAELLEEDARTAAKALREMGITLDEAVSLITKFWEVD